MYLSQSYHEDWVCSFLQDTWNVPGLLQVFILAINLWFDYTIALLVFSWVELLKICTTINKKLFSATLLTITTSALDVWQ